MAIQVSLKELIESSAHFGHQARRWNPKMAPYLYGIKDGVHVFDLTKTKEKLAEALAALTLAAKEGKSILFVGTKKQAKEKIRQVAQATSAFYVNERWLGGTLSNFEQIKKSINKLADMKAKMAQGAYKIYTKKERLLIEREIARLERFFGGIAGMTKIPELLVVIDTKKEIGAVKEANEKGLQVFGIVDSNSDPTLIDYPIPMNDDANKAIEYVLGLMEEAILAGKAKTKKVKNEKTEKLKSI